MAVVPPPNEPKEELWKVICKECRGEVDDVGCSDNCKHFEILLAHRKPDTLEYHVYLLDRIEPYFNPCP